MGTYYCCSRAAPPFGARSHTALPPLPPPPLAPPLTRYDDDEGIAAQESQYSSFVGTTYSTFENGAPADATPPPKPKPKAKSSSKKKTKAKAILMEEDGTTPNWDERLKKSLAPRAERKPPVGGKWSAAEDARLKEIVEGHGAKNWKNIAALLGTLRNDVQCLHR